MPRLIVPILLLILLPLSSFAQERSFRLGAPAELIDTGLLGHLLPRFTLKHRIRITLVAPGETASAELVTTGDDTPVFSGPNNTWHFRSQSGEGAEYRNKFGEWLTSEVGRNTIESYQPDDTLLFIAYSEEEIPEPEPVFEGDALTGEKLAMLHCGRCHVINDSNRMKAIGSTPSFALLKTFNDWDVRFQTFYTLNPHPAFTQIADVTSPFPANTPSPIVPLELTVEDLDAILAYVTHIEPADLGMPIEHQ
ncbi:MAG: c-type cytochrome [Paracoccaceae bacterium]